MLTRTEQLPDIGPAVELIGLRHRALAADRALLVALSGIDGSGKGFVAKRLETRLVRAGLRTALIGIDPRQHPQSVRLSHERSGVHFYEHAFRWQELFSGLVDPLVRKRSVDVVVNAIRTDVDRFYPRQYRFENVDVVLLEGTFLLKHEFVQRYDLRFWVACSFETALGRAHVRNQEGLTREELERDYRRICFPAQRLHFERDKPRLCSDVVVVNDPLLVERSRESEDERCLEETPS